MDATKILLICGAGASSGFMAAAIRKAAKKTGDILDVQAASESQLDNYLPNIDILLIASHMAFREKEFEDKAKEHNVKVAVLPPRVYMALDGQGGLKVIQDLEK